jgi:hypothetical protein
MRHVKQAIDLRHKEEADGPASFLISKISRDYDAHHICCLPGRLFLSNKRIDFLWKHLIN